MRRALRVGLFTAMLAPSAALAQTGSGCDPDAAGCARAPIAFRFREGLPTEFDFDTNWVPPGSPVQVRVRAALAGHTSVDQAGELVASWPAPMRLQAVGNVNGGALEVDYGVQFSARIRLALEVEGRSIGWEGAIPYVPMIDFRATGRTAFDPWAWEGVSAMGRTARVRVADVPITDAIVRIPGISGGFSFEASGDVSATYRSTRMTFGLAADPITAMSLRTQGAFTAGTFVEYAPRLEGDLAYRGALHVYPQLYVSLAGRRWMLDLADIPIAFGPFPRAVTFDPSTARLGLPDLRATRDVVDFGDIDVGRETSQTVEIRNDGELDGRILGADTEAPFAVDASPRTVPVRARTSVVVRFAPVRPGPIGGELVVRTSDPDTPRIRVRLRANGVAMEPPPVEDAGTDASTDAGAPSASQDGGCGCAVPGAGTRGGVSGLWIVGIAAVARRRRQGVTTSKRSL